MPDQPNPSDSPGVKVFGFDSVDEIIELGRNRPTLTEINERLKDRRREERIRKEIPDDFLDKLVDAKVPSPYLRRHMKWQDAELVYFLQAEDGGPVKVGTTLDHALYRRITSLQIGNPLPLVLRRLVYGGFTVETTIHSFLHDYLIRGEWFRDEGKVAEVIRPDGVLRNILRPC